MFNYVLRLVNDRSLAEDLTQEVFLRVFQGLPKFSLRSKFTTWLFQVTKNRVLDELRAIERRPKAVVALEDVPTFEQIREEVPAYAFREGDDAGKAAAQRMFERDKKELRAFGIQRANVDR